VLSCLASQGHGPTLTYIHESLKDFASSDAAHIENAKSAAVELFISSDQNIWHEIEPVFEASPEFMIQVLAELESGHEVGIKRVSAAIGISGLGRVFELLDEYLPPEPTGEDAVFSRGEDMLHWFKNSILTFLGDEGTTECIQEIERLRAALPRYDWLKVLQRRAEAVRKRKAWASPSISQVLKMNPTRKTRLVESPAQLLEVTLEALREVRHRMQTTDDVLMVWNIHRDATGSHRYDPKDEPQLALYIKNRLQDQLQGTEVILNREVETSVGDEADILVQATRQLADGSKDVVGVVIEAKCCWHDGLMECMRTQLVDRYLTNAGLVQGIYLVGWYACERWDADSNKRRRARAMTDETDVLLKAQADSLSQEPLRIEYFGLDCRLH
jgi:hypothetical protein